MTDRRTLEKIRDPANRDAILRLIDAAYVEMKGSKAMKRKKGMNREQILGRLAKREAAFRIHADCTACVYYQADKFGAYKCEKPENEETCRAGFEKWMKGEVE